MSSTPLSTVPSEETATPADAQAAVILPTLMYAFAPLHKRAFGVATGTAAATFMLVVSIAKLTLPTARDFPLYLLDEYFAGYGLTFFGILAGVAWGFVVGFVGGWFGAFCRNLALAVSQFIIRTRAELNETRDFLDHI